MPLSAPQYFELLDWTGRQIRQGKCGLIPAELAPILDRLSVNSDSWMRLFKSFRRLSRQAAGTPSSFANDANRRGQLWLQGTNVSHSFFNATVT